MRVTEHLYLQEAVAMVGRIVFVPSGKHKQHAYRTLIHLIKNPPH